MRSGTARLGSTTTDAASRITNFDSLLDGLTVYNYDARDQLTSVDDSSDVTDATYDYDENGNRLTNTLEGNNRVTNDGTYTYQYDDEGNRTLRTNIATGATTDYVWDNRNRLVSITDKTIGGSVTKTVEYTYDAFDHRIAKSITMGGSTNVEYSIHEGSHVALRLDGAGTVTNRYLHGPAIDMVLADEQVDVATGDSDTLWALTDHLGSVRDLVDLDAAVTSIANHITYGAFGEVVSETDATVDHIFAFTGRDRDEESDLQYNRARYYDAALGQWLSEDPIGFAAGDANLRRYVGNGPMGAIDPTGEAEIKLPTNKLGVGVWLDGPSFLNGSSLSDKAVRANGGNGWFILESGKKVQYINSVPQFAPHYLKTAGQPWIVKVVATGTSAGDIAAAQAAACELASTQYGRRFKGMEALKGTWHHLGFDRKTQQFTFVLVDEIVHNTAKHTGGFAAYLDWAADTLNDVDKARNLSDDAALALHRTLSAKATSTRLKARLNKGWFGGLPKGAKIVQSRGAKIAKTIVTRHGLMIVSSAEWGNDRHGFYHKPRLSTFFPARFRSIDFLAWILRNLTGRQRQYRSTEHLS